MRTTFCLLAIVAALPAQNQVWTPAPSVIQEGNANNTIPFWATSSTYQQIHDYENLAPVLGAATPLLGLLLRKDASNTVVPGRTFDLQMTVGMTTVSATAPTSTYATNLGGSATVVLPYTPINFPSLSHISTPNPAGLIVPWNTPFVYVAIPGQNLCWEWRHMNASSFANASMDADSETSVTSGLEGTGCLSNGQTRTSTIAARNLSITGQTYRSRLDYAAPNAPGVLALGGQRVNISFPGQCAPLLVNPLVFLSGATDATGQWDMTIATPNLRGGPQVEFLGQYAWIDGLQPTGLGFSDMSFVRTAMGGTHYMCRLYTAAYQSGPGNELALTASGSGLGFGLITGFVVP